MALSDDVRRLCGLSLSDRVLRERVLAAIRRRITFDGHVFALTDPVSGVVSSPHATLPMVPSEALARLIERRYDCPDPLEWSAWLGREFGVNDVALVPLHDRYGVWGFLELWRTQTSFTAGELSDLASLSQMLVGALRTSVASFFDPEALSGAARGEQERSVEPGVILLDGDLLVRAQTDSAAEALLHLLPPDHDVPPVPAVAFNVGAALLAAERRTGQELRGVPPAKAWARIHLGRGCLMTARADRIAAGIAVSISPCTTAERADLFARTHALSPREVEVLTLVLRGQGSRAIADSLTIAPTTAEDHLKALLAKTGSPSRQQLLIRALGS
jgi:DNA-binding CsgD family transcriptional regulator